ncbi:lipoprotein 17-related variable surface protein [Metamycoplasma hyosynoviae]|uniref:lipoprotein 17-related variable surface protein n=1 Tax=Metamycoplasma hyosynoviae TaxID=29559 RepID=UPI002366DFCB|nr:lipoprotein 17-related variable surface protein [Metamycoplasma hyosynoviae]MDD7883908.1 lipoprotein 17-related variable surface protein [Metamycoplasma hyosynoviae]
MTKKVSALLLLNTSILVPIISTPLLVSCKNIDYKKDVKEDFTKDKSTIFASECQSIIKFGSKSGKVKYEVELVSSNDKTGEATVKITPIENNKLQTAFELKLTGFKIKLSEVLKDVKSLDLTEKEKYKVDDYISKFSTTLKDKVVVKTSEDLTLSAFFAKYKLDANANLKIKDLAKGIGTLNVQFKLGDQIENKEFEISGFLFDNTFTLVIDKILSATPPNGFIR